MTTEARTQDLATAWNKLPSSYRPVASTPTLQQAQEWCRQLAQQHYENFHVATRFLPARHRPHFYAIYAYCRVSDDLGDELGDRNQSLMLLDYWQGELDACYRGRASHPVFVALRETIRQCDIPQKPFSDLLIAFRQDQAVHRYANMNELLAYCRYSANPVGRLVLYVWGYRDAERQQFSDAICTALQLANFWQDVAEDYSRGRIYIPLDVMRAAEVTEEMIAARNATPQFRAMLRILVDDAKTRFTSGKPLLRAVSKDLAIDLDLFIRGGMDILRAIEGQKFDVLTKRPSISKVRKAALLGRALAARISGYPL